LCALRRLRLLDLLVVGQAARGRGLLRDHDARPATGQLGVQRRRDPREEAAAGLLAEKLRRPRNRRAEPVTDVVNAQQ